MFNFSDYFESTRNAGSPATGINVDPAPKGKSLVQSLTEKIASQDAELQAYKEALAHSATDNINRKDTGIPVGYAETINQLANNLADEETAYTNAARSLLEEPEEDAIRNSTRDLLATSIEDILAADKAKQLDFAEYAYQNSLLGNNNIQYLNNLVRDTLRGKYGNGVDRIKALGKHYDAVQKEINRLYRK